MDAHERAELIQKFLPVHSFENSERKQISAADRVLRYCIFALEDLGIQTPTLDDMFGFEIVLRSNQSVHLTHRAYPAEVFNRVGFRSLATIQSMSLKVHGKCWSVRDNRRTPHKTPAELGLAPQMPDASEANDRIPALELEFAEQVRRVLNLGDDADIKVAIMIARK